MLRQITSLQNPLVKHLVKLRQNRDYRYDHQSLLLEGVKPIAEVAKKITPKTLLAYDQSLIPPEVCAEEIFLVNEAVMKKVSGMTTPEGLVAEIPMPKPADLKNTNFLIALEGINDPGNLGSILRTALALGWEGAFILDDSCDPYNEKALRAARGATFRLPIGWGNWVDLKRIVQESNLIPLMADVEGTTMQSLHISRGVLLVLGNEAHGVSESTKNFCKAVTIYMPGDMESLNVAVAGGILMYFLKNG